MLNAHIDLEGLAAMHGGVILTRHLKALGLDDDEVASVTRTLYRLRHGAYALHPPANEEERHRLLARAVVLQHEGATALSHITAGVWHGLPTYEEDLRTVHLISLDGNVRRGRRHGVHVHRGPLPQRDTAVVAELVVSTVPRTIVDCARLRSLQQAVVMADHALRERLCSRGELEDVVGRMGSWNGIGDARRMLRLADPRAESPGESRTRVLLAQAGIPVDSQVEIRDGLGRFLGRVDLLLTQHPVIVEFDGRMKYSVNGNPEQAVWNEKQRQDALTDAGYVVVRVTWRDLADPATVVGRVRSAIARATVGRAPRRERRTS